MRGKGFTPLTHLPWPRVLPASNSLVWLKSHHRRGQGVGALGCRYGPEPQALEKYTWKLWAARKMYRMRYPDRCERASTRLDATMRGQARGSMLPREGKHEARRCHERASARLNAATRGRARGSTLPREGEREPRRRHERASTSLDAATRGQARASTPP